MRYEYTNSGTCSRKVSFELIDGKVYDVAFVGGCNGNLQGIGKLVEGMDADEVIARCEGIRCGFRPTSCPDRLADALRDALQKERADAPNGGGKG